MVGTRRNFNFFLEDGFLSETLLLPSLSRTCPSPLSLPFPLNLVLVEGEGWPFARNGREKGRWKGKKNFLLFKTQGRRWCQRERERERSKTNDREGSRYEGKGRRRAIRARHREARYNALRGSLHFLLPGTPLRTLTNEAAEQAAGPNGRPRKLDDNGCSWSSDTRRPRGKEGWRAVLRRRFGD